MLCALGGGSSLDAEPDRVTYLRWKARESRVAARLVGDESGRLVLLKMAQIYERLAEQLLAPWLREAERGEPLATSPSEQTPTQPASLSK
jgi:hypothetical protein